MKKLNIATVLLTSTFMVACASYTPASNKESGEFKRDPSCKVNETIARNAVPPTPNNMSLPSFGQGVIGWATGPEGAKARLENVAQKDIQGFKDKGVTLPMVKEWQAFYENEVQRNPCNPTAPFRADLMKKIADLWVD